jgi:hypothetical protein
LGAHGHHPPPRGHDHPPHHDPRHDTRHEQENRVHFEGKINGICFDQFGDFNGFTLKTEKELRNFVSTEPEMKLVVEEAWRDRLAVLVSAERSEPHEPISIVFLRARGS